MGLFDEMNLNPLVIIEDDTDGKKLPNEVDLTDDKEDKDKLDTSKKNQPVVDTIEVDTDDEPEKDNSETVADDTTTTTGDNDVAKQWLGFYQEKNLLKDIKPEEFTGSVEDLTDLIFEEEITRITEGIDSYKNSLPPVVQEILNSWEEGVEGDVLKRVVEIKAEQINLNSIKEEDFKTNKELQKQVLTNYLQKTTRLTDAKIKRDVDRLEELEELEADALEALTQSKTLLKQEEDYIKTSTKEANDQRDKDIIDNQNRLKETIKNTKEVITGIPITESERKDYENLIFQPIGRDKKGNPQFYIQKLYEEDPIGMTVKMNYLAAVTKGFTDWSKIEKKAVTTASKKVDKVFTALPPKSSTQQVAQPGDWKSNLRQLSPKKK